MHMVMIPLTLYFTKGKFLMFLISQGIFVILIQSMRKVQGKLYFYWTFHGNTICCSRSNILVFHLLFSKGFPIKRHKTAQG